MVETIQKNGLWHITLAMEDLIKQAGVNKEDLVWEGTHFLYKGREVILSHSFGEHMVVSMRGKRDFDLEHLMNSFSKVVEYDPFCRYDLNVDESIMIPTYEWDKTDPTSRYIELKNKSNILNLERI